MHIHLQGKSSWNDPGYYETGNVEAEMATRKGPDDTDVASLDLTFTNCGIEYSATLSSAPQVGWLRGTWRDRRNVYGPGKCEARMFRHEDGSIVLYGTWHEGAHSYEWFVFLH